MDPFTSATSSRRSQGSVPFRNMELLKYLETFASHLSGNVLAPDTGQPRDHSKASLPRSSHDPALTAFAQLGAQRLNAKRCLISLIDDAHQYVLAESTRSLSLRSDAVHGEDDGLWLGCSVFERSKSVCNYTVELEHHGGMPSKNNSSSIPILVVKDMTTEHITKDGEHVLGPPFLRFYAGVPICIPNTTINIGSYCILDDTPHHGDLDNSTVAFMQDMSVTIMNFLELTRLRTEHESSDKMIRGIGCFVEGKSRFCEGWPRKESESDKRTRSGRRKSSAVDIKASPGPQPTDATAKKTRLIGNTSRRSAGTLTADHPAEDDPSSFTVESIFSRASTILRQATDMCGVVFLDAVTGMTEGSSTVHARHSFSRQNSSQSDSSRETSDDDTPWSTADSDKCKILGYSMRKRDRETLATPIISTAFLAKLLQRYPRGKIFNLDDKLSDHPQGLLTPLAHTDPFEEGYSQFFLTAPDQPRVEKTTRRNEHDAFAHAFPGAQRVAFLPLFDSHRERWYAGTLTYTKKATRVLSLKDLGYMAAFGTNIMAEVGRLETVKADQAKANFISSISHELRSPLHGILGSVEFLQTTAVNAFQGNMIHTVETCARTLLDTINHLLDFAKINNFTKSAGLLGAREYSKSGSNAGKGRPSFGHMNLESDLDLRILIEEVVQTVFLGHDFQYLSKSRDKDTNVQGSELSASTHALAKKKVLVLLDIEPATCHIFHSNGGALRRILMNLSGNSLKYCESGYIRVSLQSAQPFQEKGVNKTHVTLMVSDSGKGMSKEYMRDKLFTPFAQEDALAPGTGLGLSMIKEIVTSLNGTIEVESEQGKGTEVKICLALTGAEESSDPVERRDHQEVCNVAKETSGWTVCMVGFARANDQVESDKLTAEERAAHMWSAAAGRLCTDWFLMKPVWDLGNKPDPQLYMVTPEGAEELMTWISQQKADSKSSAKKTPIIMVCQNAAAALYMAEHSTLVSQGTTVEFISQPVGPQKLSKILSLLLERQSGSPRRKSPISMHNIVNPMTTEVAKAMRGELSSLREAAPIFVRQQSQEQRVDSASTFRINLTPSPKTSPSLLIVDDNHINRQLLVTFAQKQSLPYATASNGLEAVNTYREARGSYDVILMDVTMPIMDGLEATRQIRKYEKEERIRPAMIVALTGLTAEEDHEKASDSGVDLFLEKPVRLKSLAKTLEEWTEKKSG